MSADAKKEFRDFKGVWTPKEIWIDAKLDGSMKNMWAEIHALDNDFGCTAKNEHFCRMFGFNERTVQRLIKFLRDNEYISVEVDKKDDSRVMKILGKYKYAPDDRVREINLLKKGLVDDLTKRTREMRE